MKLYEFFNIPVNKKEKENPSVIGISQEEKQKMADELFWFILDNDRLHKEYVLPFVNSMKDQITSPTFNKDRFTKMWMPMVNKGCKEFYSKHKLKKDPKELFDDSTKTVICKSLSDKFIEEFKDDAYSVRAHKK